MNMKKGVPNMLEKDPSNLLIKKLRVLLLLEADFNTLYKINFNGMLTPSLEHPSEIPKKIGNKRSQVSNHLYLRKKN